MITEYEANTLLKEKVPALLLKTYPSILSLEIYASVIFFTDITKHALSDRNFKLAKEYFELAEYLYQNGDSIVRLLIADSFILTINSVVPYRSKDMFIIKSILPQRMYRLLERHIAVVNLHGKGNLHN